VPIAVEAACASSLAALDLAVQGLYDHRYDFVLTGGIELPANPRDLVVCASLGLLSQDRITPFDKKADGFSVGEAIAMFGLKRLDDAIEHGDPIHAVIRSVGAASDAHSLIAPQMEGQALAMKRAFEQVDLSPKDIQYIETHGTGTKVGDVIEIDAIRQVYNVDSRSVPLALGSIKSMIGHTFAAAGAVGMIKTVYALKSAIIPPNVALDTINPKLDLGSIPAYVSTESSPWPSAGAGPRCAAVSSMGTGGINFHVLLESFD
jgi:acyl transferase domain-containing protein